MTESLSSVTERDDATLKAESRWELRLLTLLSVIAGMVDVIGFLALGNIFTAHITGNIVMVAAARHRDVNLAQVLAIPVFMLAVAATWILAKASGKNGRDLMRFLLIVQFFLITAVLVFTVVTNASAAPRSSMAGIAVMIAICAMACQHALLRLALPRASATAVMTGNLTSIVLSFLDMVSRTGPLMEGSSARLRKSLYLFLGFFIGCAFAAGGVALLGNWAWIFPAVLAGAAVLAVRAPPFAPRLLP